MCGVKADGAFLSEPERVRLDNRWSVDRTRNAAIWNCGTNIPTMHSVYSTDGYVRERIGGRWIYSSYLAPSLAFNVFERIMDERANDIRGRSKVLVAGDFNACAQDWGCPRTNARGRVEGETFTSLDLVLLNKGCQHTCSRAGQGQS